MPWMVTDISISEECSEEELGQWFDVLLEHHGPNNEPDGNEVKISARWLDNAMSLAAKFEPANMIDPAVMKGKPQ